MLCIDNEYTYMGATVRTIIYTTSTDICEEVKQVFSKGYEAAMDSIKRYGCIIESEQPLKITSRDRGIEIVIEPKNFLAKMFWREAINKIKSLCQSQ